MQTPPRPAHRPSRRVRMRALAALCALGACVALAACGSSGSSTSASTTTGTGTSASKAGGSSRFTALRSCLQKQGITLPAPPSGGTGGPGGPGGPGAPGGGRGLQAPEGVSQSKFQEALKKCGGGNFRGGGSANLNSATARAALTSYAACMRSNGVNVPAPNTSGNGPIFNTTGINTSSTQFKTAQSKCQSDLKGVFPGGGAGGGAGGAPPSAGA
jgi:hypothetical protein